MQVSPRERKRKKLEPKAILKGQLVQNNYFKDNSISLKPQEEMCQNQWWHMKNLAATEMLQKCSTNGILMTLSKDCMKPEFQLN